MKILIVGYGVQGKKRKKNLKKKNYYKIYDPYIKSSETKTKYDLDLKKFDAAYICTPDSKKFEIIKYLLEKKKHVLVEKPLSVKSLANYQYGELYGINHDANRFHQKWLRASTDIKNLYLTGQDIVTVGVTSALFSGLLTASSIFKKNLMKELNN